MVLWCLIEIIAVVRGSNGSCLCHCYGWLGFDPFSDLFDCIISKYIWNDLIKKKLEFKNKNGYE